MVSERLKTSSGLTTLLLLALAFLGVTVNSFKPHILHIEVGEAGWADVGWNSPEMHTPFLDRLRSRGVDLPFFYAQPTPAASRIAMLTGRYPYKLGFKSIKGMFFRYHNFTLPLEYKLYPEYLQERGYSTHLSGTWSMGFCNNSYLPESRGFESFYGSLGSFQDHYNHTPVDLTGYDFWNGTRVLESAKGRYSTTLFTERAVEIVTNHSCRNDDRPLYVFLSFDALRHPLQAPGYFIDLCSAIEDPNRKFRCAMMAAIDSSVRQVIRAFKDAEYFDDLVVLFHSSSGGPPNFGSSNFPLRGKKATVYEGGTRVPAFFFAQTLLKDAASSFGGFMHITDLFPTLLKVAKTPTACLPNDIDGVNQWSPLVEGRASVRSSMVYDIDVTADAGAFRLAQYKLIRSRRLANQKCPGYYNFPPESNKTRRVECKEWELYSIDLDPYEENDVSDEQSFNMIQLTTAYQDYASLAPPHVLFVNVTESYPENNGGLWQPYGC